MNLKLARSLGAGRFSEWVAVDASGSARGILLIWDKRILEVNETVCGSFTASCSFRNVEDGFHWIFTGVYGPVLASLKEEMWEELGSVRGLWDGPWCIGGDFNASISPNESNMCDAPDPGPTRLANPNRFRGAKPYTGTP